MAFHKALSNMSFSVCFYKEVWHLMSRFLFIDVGKLQIEIERYAGNMTAVPETVCLLYLNAT